MDAPTLTKLVGELNKAAAPKPDSDSRSDEEYKKETAEVSFITPRNLSRCIRLGRRIVVLMKDSGEDII